jgi:type I restriction enzyme S subunit
MRLTTLEEIVENLPCSYGADIGSYPATAKVVKVSNIDDAGNFRGRFAERSFSPSELEHLVVRTGELLVVKSSGNEANILSGKTAICDESREGKIVASNFLLRLRPKTEAVWPRYLWYFLNSRQSKAFVRTIVGAFTYPNLNWSLYGRHPVPLPSFFEQKRIAALLEKADRLRRTRRYARQLSDTFLQSVFLEMFGDSFRAEESKMRFGDLVKITGGGTPSRDIAVYFTGTIPWLTSKDMRGDYIFDTQEHVTDAAVANSATQLVPAGSVLVVVKSKVLMHRLPVAISLVPLCHGQDIKSIQCSNKLLPEFARYLLRYYERHLLNLARGANTEGLTLPMLNELLVPDVSLQLQQEFADIVRRFERLRAQQREAERQAEHLFQTLLDRAFKAEV